MKKDKLIKEFESMKIDNANSIIGGECVHPTAHKHWEKTNDSNNPNDFHMDEIVLYFNDADEGDTLTIQQLITPLDL